jgi:hypothetical protein
MALATGPFTTNLNPGTVTPKSLLFAQAQDGDVEALNAVMNKPNAPQVIQFGTIATASTGVFTLGATAAAAIALVGAPAVGDGVFLKVKVAALGAAVADCARYEANFTALNLAGTLTIVGAVVTGGTTQEGAAGLDGVLTLAAGIPTFTYTAATTNTVNLRVEWTAESLSGAF